MAGPKTPSKRHKSKRRRPQEPIPVFAGRLWIGLALLIAMWAFPFPLGQLAGAFDPGEEPPVNMMGWTAGQAENIRITLISADYDRLACVLDRKISGVHCEYETETKKWERDRNAPLDNNRKQLIQPYSASPGNSLILVAGLWSHPDVAMRIHNEPAGVVPEKKQARFLVDCQVKPLEKLSKITLRWSKTQKWAKQGPAWVAIAESCTVVVD
jgi:hypothetical protein